MNPRQDHIYHLISCSHTRKFQFLAQILPGLRVFRAIFYFIGVIFAAFGLTGVGVQVLINSSYAGGVALGLGFGLLVVGILIFLLARLPVQGLHWSQCILWIIVDTLGGFLLFFLAVTLKLGNVISNYLFGLILYCDFLFYGLVLMGIARKKATLFQRVQESVHRILMTMPGQQIPLSELVKRLQNEQKYSTKKLYRYLEKFGLHRVSGCP